MNTPGRKSYFFPLKFLRCFLHHKYSFLSAIKFSNREFLHHIFSKTKFEKSFSKLGQIRSPYKTDLTLIARRHNSFFLFFLFSQFTSELYSCSFLLRLIIANGKCLTIDYELTVNLWKILLQILEQKIEQKMSQKFPKTVTVEAILCAHLPFNVFEFM